VCGAYGACLITFLTFVIDCNPQPHGCRTVHKAEVAQLGVEG